jgi:hypothetical protein
MLISQCTAPRVIRVVTFAHGRNIVRTFRSLSTFVRTDGFGPA